MKMKRVLIADGEEENRYLLRSLLQENGYEIITAVNGAQALDMARQTLSDMIISDIFMPVMDGFILCHKWKKDELLHSIPFVFHRATFTDDRDKEFANSLGATRFIT